MGWKWYLEDKLVLKLVPYVQDDYPKSNNMFKKTLNLWWIAEIPIIYVRTYGKKTYGFLTVVWLTYDIEGLCNIKGYRIGYFHASYMLRILCFLSVDCKRYRFLDHILSFRAYVFTRSAKSLKIRMHHA